MMCSFNITSWQMHFFLLVLSLPLTVKEVLKLLDYILLLNIHYLTRSIVSSLNSNEATELEKLEVLQFRS